MLLLYTIIISGITGITGITGIDNLLAITGYLLFSK
jgi:hypothetical protein